MRLLHVLSRYGLGGAAREATRRLAHAIVSEKKLLIFKAPVDEIRRVAPRLDAGTAFTARVMTLDEALRLAASRPAVLSALRAHIEDVRDGEELLVGCVGDRLAAWNIVSCSTRQLWPLTETASELPLSSADAVFTAGFVAEEFRRRHLFQAMYGASADLAKSHRASTLWSWCEAWNDPSRRAMLAVGFRYMGSHARRTILGFPGKLRIESGIHD